MKKCYLCDSEIKTQGRSFKIGAKEELICDSCYTKTVNRRKALGLGEGKSA
ncbi:MAG: hypothetical protein OK455_03355 [Thaumarchaeota archaeon]|nr:hypothetical protein [Nitrososphaerota archaeon]